MRSKKQTVAVAAALFAAFAMPVRLAAQEDQKQSKEHVRYKLIDVGTFGGPNSYVNGPGLRDISNQGTYVGEADTSTPDSDCGVPGCFVQHAQKWSDGIVTDLGTLPGVNNNSGAVWISANGRFIAGSSENGLIDPLLGWPEGRAVLWTEEGRIIDLGTIEGGNQSFGTGVNNRGQVIGVSTNTTTDPFSMFCFGFGCAATQTRSFLWQDGVMQDLGTLGGPDAFADQINERGQITGSSYTNSTPNSTTGIPTTDPFLWDKGTMVDIGTVGGTSGVPLWLNNRGQVIGISNVAGDQTAHPFFWDRGVLTDIGTFGGSYGEALRMNDSGQVIGKADFPGNFIHHAFVWKNGVMTDVGVVPGDLCTNGRAINAAGQAVGTSTNCMGVVQHLFLWENGVIHDLNALILPRI